MIARAELRTPAPGTVEATLTMIEPSGKRWSRQVRSATCDEALDALALVLAVALAPEQTLPEPSESPAPPPPPPPPRSRPESPRTPKPPPSTDDDAKRRAAATPPPAPEPPPEPPAPVEIALPPPAVDKPIVLPPPPPAEPRLVGAAGAGAIVLSGPSPQLMTGVAVHASLRWKRDSVISPALIVRGVHYWSDEYVANGGVADFSLDSGALSLCPVWLQEHRVSVQLCALGEIGRLVAQGSETNLPKKRQRLFVSMSASLQIDVDIGQGVHVMGMGAAGMPLMRDSFQFRPAVFYEVPLFVLSAGAGLVVQFL